VEAVAGVAEWVYYFGVRSRGGLRRHAESSSGGSNGGGDGGDDGGGSSSDGEGRSNRWWRWRQQQHCWRWQKQRWQKQQQQRGRFRRLFVSLPALVSVTEQFTGGKPGRQVPSLRVEWRLLIVLVLVSSQGAPLLT
jgi:hypothetical protein